MKKTILFWLMFVLAIALAVYFAVRIITSHMSVTANLDTMAANLAARPQVRLSAVRRLPNNKISQRTELHRGIAHWTNGTDYFPLTADGTIVNSPAADRPENSVVFRGKLPPDISQIVKSAQKLSDNIDYMEWIESRRWNLVAKNGAVVQLPELDMSAAFEQLQNLHNKNQILTKNIKTLDMRDSARILVK